MTRATSLIIHKTGHFSALGSIDIAARTLTVSMTGSFNEQTHLKKVSLYITGMESDLDFVTLDLWDINDITSAGLRDWLVFIGHLEKCKFQVSFSRVGEVFLEKTSMFPGILGREGTPINAFAAPFYCTPCKKRTLVPVEVSKMNLKSQAPVIPGAKCDNCGNAMDFDDIPQTYFQFLQRLGRLKP